MGELQGPMAESGPALIPRPGYIGSEDANPEFAGMVARLDHQVGQIMALLKTLNIDDNTIVFFTSDNGPQPGAWKDIFVEFFDGAAGCAEPKGTFTRAEFGNRCWYAGQVGSSPER